MRKYSLITPVYNRPDEVRELLDSLTRQTYRNFEVLIIEDGSRLGCENVVNAFKDQLDVKYFYKENSGQGFSRNFAFERAGGDWFVLLDSDCIIPEHYLEMVDAHLNVYGLDAYGGPDRAHPAFNPVQKAISYAMTSPFSTGGIRGNKKHVGQFHPRSFNMGLSRPVWEKVGGFTITRMAEDLEFSVRIIRQGFKVGLIEEAFVYHKRRSTFRQFFKQLHFFGRARINLSRFFPEELKLVHTFPLLFTLFLFSLPLLLLVYWPLGLAALAFLFLYSLTILVDATAKNRRLLVGLLSVGAVFTQLTGYGIGFLSEGWKKWRETRQAKANANVPAP